MDLGMQKFPCSYLSSQKKKIELAQALFHYRDHRPRQRMSLFMPQGNPVSQGKCWTQEAVSASVTNSPVALDKLRGLCEPLILKRGAKVDLQYSF